MSRTTLLFGNGLGLALDNEYFQLKNALCHAWDVDDEFALSDDEKLKVCRCINSTDIILAPTKEEELETLQRVIAACDFLNEIGDHEVHWLSADAQPFPDAVRRYLGRAASYFHRCSKSLPAEFLNSLETFIKSTLTPPHVATLNYDNLLYRPFIDRNLCAGYDGYLVDGFYKCGFEHDNLKRRFGKKFGWYLHLHGCPLFAEEIPGVITKLSQSALAHSHHLRKHLILTHYLFKPGLIQHSKVLCAYLEYFKKALQESNLVVCFGYSGLDNHVNQTVREVRRSVDFDVLVIEWDGGGTLPTRQTHWEQCFGPKVKLRHYNNILDFRFESLLPDRFDDPPPFD